jgi:hypothetical protein
MLLEVLLEVTCLQLCASDESRPTRGFRSARYKVYAGLDGQELYGGEPTCERVGLSRQDDVMASNT